MIKKNENKYYKIIKFYKEKLVDFGVMKELKNNAITGQAYTGRKVLCKR